MGTLASGSIDLKSLKVAGEPNKYITYIDATNGIRVHEAGAVNMNFVQINSTGMSIYVGGQADSNKIAEFSSYITLGNRATASTIGNNSIAMGTDVKATGNFSLAMGYSTTASGNYSHAEGWNTTASGAYSHAEGSSGQLDGEDLIASGTASHAEGFSTQAAGRGSHAGGQYSEAIGDYSFAHGNGVVTAEAYQVAFGRYNEADAASLFTIGNGKDSSNKNNAFVVGSTYLRPVQDVIAASSGDTTLTTVMNIDSLISIEDTDGNNYTGTKTANKTITLDSALTSNVSLTVTYSTSNNWGYIYTSGAILEKLGAYSFSQGYAKATGFGSHAFGFRGMASTKPSKLEAQGMGSLAYGYIASSDQDTAANTASQIIAQEDGAFAHGYVKCARILAKQKGSFAGGYGTANSYPYHSTITASAIGAMAYGRINNYSQYRCVAAIDAQGQGSFARGYAGTGRNGSDHSRIIAEANGSSAFGHTYISSNKSAQIIARGEGSLASGVAQGDTEDTYIIASGDGALAFGGAYNGTLSARGTSAVALNINTNAMGYAQTVIGKYNVSQGTLDHCTTTDYAFIIGNGVTNSPSNALTVDWGGNLIAQGMAGMIQMFAGSTLPTNSGWLLCDGAEYLKTDYPTLYSVIGDTFGTHNPPSDSDHFRVPDLRGRVPIGSGHGDATGHTAHSLGDRGGNENAIVPYHRHGPASGTYMATGSTSFSVASNKATSTTGSGISDLVRQTGTISNPQYTDYAGTSGNTTGANMMPYLTINYIICTGKTS